MSKKKTQTQDLFSMVDFENDKVSEKESDEKNVDYADKSEVIEEQITNDNTNTIGNNDKTMEQKEYKKYSVAEVKEATIKYFDGDQLAADVWMNKYALKDSDGNIFELTPDDMHHRIASEIARIENMYPNPMSEEEIFEVLKDFRYIVPQGSPMAGIGNNFQISSLSNCFVIGTNGKSDSYGAIMKIDQEQVQLMKRRGGVGHDLSHIRPAGSPVKNCALTSTGLSTVYPSAEAVLEVIEKCILLFRAYGEAGERFADTVARLGFARVEELLATNELLDKKSEILADA